MSPDGLNELEAALAEDQADDAISGEQFLRQLRATLDRSASGQGSPDAYFGATSETLKRYSARMEAADSREVSALVALVQRVVDESGDPVGFDAAAWTSRWLSSPLPALGGVCPMEYMSTQEGRALLEGLTLRMQSGAYT